MSVVTGPLAETSPAAEAFLAALAHPARDRIAAGHAALVVAHPDDESIGCGAQLPRLRLHSAAPATAWVSGGTTVTLRGRGFGAPTARARCRIGPTPGGGWRECGRETARLSGSVHPSDRSGEALCLSVAAPRGSVVSCSAPSGWNEAPSRRFAFFHSFSSSAVPAIVSHSAGWT